MYTFEKSCSPRINIVSNPYFCNGQFVLQNEKQSLASMSRWVISCIFHQIDFKIAQHLNNVDLYKEVHLWPLRATMWVGLDESTKRYAIASRLHIYRQIFKIDLVWLLLLEAVTFPAKMVCASGHVTLSTSICKAFFFKCSGLSEKPETSVV